MVWYDPRTWFKKPSYPEVGSVTKEVPAGVTTPAKAVEYGQKVAPTIAPSGTGLYVGGGGYISGGREVSGGGTALPSTSSISTMPSTGTGYDPATRVQTGITPATTKLPTAQSVAEQILKRNIGESEASYRHRVSQLTAEYSAIGILYEKQNKDINEFYRRIGYIFPKTEISSFNIPSSPFKTSGSVMSAYTEEAISRAPLSNWQQAVKSSLGAGWYNIQSAFGRRTDKGYKSLLEPFQYTSPLIRKENIAVYGGIPEQIKYPKKETIIGAQYYPDVSYERIGGGALVTKYGETAGIVAGSFVVPQLTSGYLMFTGIKELSEQKVSGLVRFGAGTIPLAVELRNIAKPMGDITKIRIAELQKAPAKVYGEEIYVTEKGSVYNIVAQKKVPYAMSETYLTTATKVKGEKLFSIPTIRAGYTKTAIEDWWTGKPIEQLTKFTTAGKGEIVSGASRILKVSKGVKYEIPEEIIKATGTGYYSPTGTITKFLGKTTYKEGEGFIPFRYGGLTKVGEKYYSIAGIKPTGARFYLGEQYGKKTLIGDISQYGLIKKYVPPEKSNIIIKNLMQTTKQFPTTAEFTEQVSKISTGSIFKDIDKTFISGQSSKILTSLGSVSTLKQLEKSTQQQKTILTSGLKFRQLEGLEQKQEQKQKVIPYLKTSPLLDVSQINRQVSGVISILRETQLQKEMTKTTFATPILSVPRVPVSPPYIPTTFFVPPILPWLPKFEFDESLSKRMFAGKQRYKYTPSYEALVFKIKGKAPKGIEIGARLRPITKGFAWAYKTSPMKFGSYKNFGKRLMSGSSFKAPKLTKFKMPNLKTYAPSLDYYNFYRRKKRRRRR